MFAQVISVTVRVIGFDDSVASSHVGFQDFPRSKNASYVRFLKDFRNLELHEMSDVI